MPRHFEDIRIAGLDIDRTQPSQKAPGLRHMYLSLSGLPPAEWAEFFQEQRKFPRHTMWRDAWIEGPYIVIDCVPEEIEKYHLKDLKEDVRKANEKFREWELQDQARSVRQQQEAEAERKRQLELKKRLKFD